MHEKAGHGDSHQLKQKLEHHLVEHYHHRQRALVQYRAGVQHVAHECSGGVAPAVVYTVRIEIRSITIDLLVE
jgi:hypothetical protein